MRKITIYISVDECLEKLLEAGLIEPFERHPYSYRYTVDEYGIMVTKTRAVNYMCRYLSPTKVTISSKRGRKLIDDVTKEFGILWPVLKGPQRPLGSTRKEEIGYHTGQDYSSLTGIEWHNSVCAFNSLVKRHDVEKAYAKFKVYMEKKYGDRIK